MKSSLIFILFLLLTFQLTFSLVIPKRVDKDLIITENAVLESNVEIWATLHFKGEATLDMKGFNIRLGMRARLIFNGTSDQKIHINGNGGSFIAWGPPYAKVIINNAKFTNLEMIKGRNTFHADITNSEFTTDKDYGLSFDASVNINKSFFKGFPVLSLGEPYRSGIVHDCKFEDIGRLTHSSTGTHFNKCEFKSIKVIKALVIKDSILDGIGKIEAVMRLNKTIIKNSGIEGEPLCTCGNNAITFVYECIIRDCKFENNRGSSIIKAINNKSDWTKYIGFSVFKNNRASESLISSGLEIARGNRFENNNAKYLYKTISKEKEVDVRNNYWGTINSKEISAKIYDNKQDPTLAKVIFQPFLKE